MTLNELKLVEEVLKSTKVTQCSCIRCGKWRILLESTIKLTERDIRMKETDFVTGKIKEDAS